MFKSICLMYFFSVNDKFYRYFLNVSKKNDNFFLNFKITLGTFWKVVYLCKSYIHMRNLQQEIPKIQLTTQWKCINSIYGTN